MRRLLLIAVFHLVVIGAENKCEYNIVAPKAVKLGENFYFNVDYQCTENSTFALKASIVAWSRYTTRTPPLTLVSKQFVVNSGDYKRFSLEVPKVNHRRSTINFTVEATGDEDFNKTTPIQSNRKYLSLFIQTDKHYYKPGQTVHYRVIAFDGYLKPYTKPFNITIHDNRRNLVGQRLLESSEFGILKGELHLSPSTPLGDWRLTAKCEDTIKTVYFSVSEYVLPKYKIEIKTPKYYLINPKPATSSDYNDDEDDASDENSNPSSSSKNSGIEDFKFSISAKYTFGKPVKGVANVYFTLSGRYHGGRGADVSYTKIAQLEGGKADVSVSYDELLSLIPCKNDYDRLDYRTINIKVVVFERETGNQLIEQKAVQVRSGKFKLDYIGHNSYFKAGFKTREFLQLKHISGSNPMLEDIRYPNGSMKSLAVRVWYTMANYSSRIEQRMLTPLNKNGIAVIELNVHDMVEKISIETSFYDSSMSQSTQSPHKQLTAIKTRDKKLLDLQLKRGKGLIRPNKEIFFTVNASEPITTFYYQIFGKNVLVVSEKFVGESSKNHEFSIHCTEKLAVELAPTAQIVAFYVNSHGELVADGMKIEVDDYFANKVSLTFNATTVLPSSKVALNIKAANESYVGYFAIDQSVLLMGSYDLFSQKQIETDLAEYSVRHFPNWTRKKRSIEEGGNDNDVDGHDNDVAGDDDDDYSECGKLLWPFHTLARSTSDLLSNAGVVLFSSNYIHHHVQYYDYQYNDEEFDDDVPMNMVSTGSAPRAQASPSRSALKSTTTTTPSSSNAPAVRENFPETWFWVDFVKTTSEDQQEVLTVPDTMTEWLVSAFSTHKDKGIGVSKSAHLTVFQPLFLSANLPASIIRGEELALTITVFNYNKEATNATVTLKKSDDFKVKRCDSDNINDLIGDDVVRTFEIKSEDAASFQVWLVASSVGHITIHVEATSAAGGDAVKRKLLVKPEGEQQWQTKSSFIKPTPSSPHLASFAVQLPPADIYVPDSAIHQLTVIGDILAPMTANIGNLISVPKGCGEQNIVNLAPNVYSLSYLKAANVTDEGLRNKLLSHINSGYQQQLTFRRYDNSYSAFGEDDAAGSTWLTAFVLKCFRDAQEHIFISNEHLEDNIKWLLGRQTSEGNFEELPESRIIHSKMQGGSASTLTAYVLIALTKTQLLPRPSQQQRRMRTAIDKACRYLEQHLDDYNNDPYALSIVAYGLHLEGKPSLERVLERLDQLATKKDDKTFWQQQTPSNASKLLEDPLWIAFGEQPPTHEIEMTAYNLLIRAEQGSIEQALPIAQWLIEQGNGRGGFVSTQDTVLAIEAVSKFARLILETNDPHIQVNVTYHDGTEDVTEVLSPISKVNSLVLQTIDIPSSADRVQVSASGEGFALIQLVSRFNTFRDLTNTDLHLQLDSEITDKQINLTITTKWTGEERSGMVLIEVGLLTGYTLHDVDMLRLLLRGVVKKVEVGVDAVNFYLDQLSETEVSFWMSFDQDTAVHAIKPAPVQAYRYYQPKIRATKYYTASSGRTWVSACPQCCE